MNPMKPACMQVYIDRYVIVCDTLRISWPSNEVD